MMKPEVILTRTALACQTSNEAEGVGPRRRIYQQAAGLNQEHDEGQGGPNYQGNGAEFVGGQQVHIRPPFA